MPTQSMGLKKQARYYWSRALTRLGESIKSDRLIYNGLVRQHFADHARQNAPALARIIRAAFPDSSTAVDLGCGSGHFVAALRAAGIRAEGYEYSAQLRRTAARELGVTIHPFDLADPPVMPQVDLALSIEVAEHLQPLMGDTLVRLLTTSAPTVWFTAARPHQGGAGHVNEQPAEYWISRFKKYGYEFDQSFTEQLRPRIGTETVKAPWLAENLLIFRQASPADVS